MMIHLSRDGKDLGQFTLTQVNAMLASGQLQSTDFAWKEGMPNWVALSLIEGVAATASPRSAPLTAPRTSVTAPVRSNSTTQAVYAPPRGAVGTAPQYAGQVPAGTIRALKETRPWVLFLAILGLIGTALMLLGALSVTMMGSMVGARAGIPAAGLALMVIAYVLLALLYVYPIIKLFKFCGAIQRLTHSGAAPDLDEAMRQQKSFWKFIGILTLVMIVIYLVIILLVVVAGVRFAPTGGPGPSGLPFPPPP